MALVVDNEAHYALAYRYLQILAVELRTALHQQGIRDVKVQRKIVDSFLFQVAYSWDDGRIEDETARSGKWHPTPCFRSSNGIGQSDVLVVPSGEDAFHEMAVFGAIEDAFTPDDPERDWKFKYDGVEGSSIIGQLSENHE